MNDESIDRVLERAIPDDAPAAARERFRDLRTNPPPEGNAAETTVEELDLELSLTLFYEFDFGDGWEHHLELREIREGSLDEPTVVDVQGESPPQYPTREG